MNGPLNKCLVISYDSDQQQWFYDTVLAESTSAAEKFILKMRPYCLAADGSLSVDFRGNVSMHISGCEWDASEPLSQCQDCELVFPQSHLAEIKDLAQRVEPEEPMPSGECPECGALCHRIEVSA